MFAVVKCKELVVEGWGKMDEQQTVSDKGKSMGING